MHARHRIRTFPTRACRLAAVTMLVATALMTATARATTTSTTAGEAFAGKVCGLIPKQDVTGAGVDAPCVQLPTRHGKPYIAAYTANWGTQIVAGGADHFLGVSVSKPTSAYLTSAKFAFKLAVSTGHGQAIGHGLEGIEKVLPYNFGKKKGFSDYISFIAHGYICVVNLFNKSQTNPPLAADVSTDAFIIASVLSHKL